MAKMGDSSSISSAANDDAPTVELKYTGVRKRKWGKYVSEIRLPNSRERIWLGSYDTAEKAARAFDAAMFCLRGPNSKFNFPDDPPNIPGGSSMSPAEILAVSQQYGNSFCSGHPAEDRGEFRAQLETEETSPPSNSIDWSFLDMPNWPGEDMINGNESVPADFYLFHEPGYDVYLPWHIAADDVDDNGNGNVPYFLWNF